MQSVRTCTAILRSPLRLAFRWTTSGSSAPAPSPPAAAHGSHTIHSGCGFSEKEHLPLDLVADSSGTDTQGSSKSGSSGSVLSSAQLRHAEQYCQDLVRKVDHDNYLCALMLPDAEARRGVFALRAFNAELARVRESVREELVGQMRFQWWRDVISSAAKGSPPAQPIAQLLGHTMQTFRLRRLFLDRLIDQREADLRARPPASIAALEKYGEATAATLLYLQMQCMRVTDVQADHAASHVGRAMGLLTALRATPHVARHRRLYLPLDVLMKHQVSVEDVYRGTASAALAEAVFQVADTAHAHLRMARELATVVPDRAKPVLLPAVVVDFHLERLRRCHFNVFDQAFATAPAGPLLPLKLGWARMRGVY